MKLLAPGRFLLLALTAACTFVAGSSDLVDYEGAAKEVNNGTTDGEKSVNELNEVALIYPHDEEQDHRSNLRGRGLQQQTCATFAAGVYYHITARHSGMALHVDRGSSANGANIIQWPVHKSSRDNWRLQPTNGGYYSIVNQKTGKVANVLGGSDKNGAQIAQYSISPRSNDDWCFSNAGGEDGYFYIIARHSGKVLDVERNSMNAGANVHQWERRNGAHNQQWAVSPIDGSRRDECKQVATGGHTYQLTARHSGMAVAVKGASKDVGASIVQAPFKSTGTNDNWSFKSTSNGYYSIVNQNSGLVLNVRGGIGNNGAYVIQWRLSNRDNDDWCFQDAGDGYYNIKARHSGKYLDVFGARKTAGTPLHQWTRNNGPNQDWKLTRVAKTSSPAPNDKSPKWAGPYGLTIVAGAGANLPDGRILLWSSYARSSFQGGDRGGKTQITIFDPNTLKSTSREVANTQHDMFCPGTAVLPDGEILITGGNKAEATTSYNPKTNVWSKESKMNIPRGYHSMTVLQDGNVLTIGGSFSGGRGNKSGEIFDVRTRTWRRMDGIVSGGSMLTNDARGVYRADNHMWLFTAPNGKVFHAGPSKRMHWITTSGKGSVRDSVVRGNDDDAMNGNAVMYDVGKILTLGGAADYDKVEASNRAYVIDINNENNVRVQQTGSMAYRRSFSSSVVLPTGHVIVVGGMPVATIFSDCDAVLMAEMWDPSTGRFTKIGNMDIARTYHSIALLLKDGRVLAAGGGLCVGCSVNHADAEILTPPYLLNADGSPKSRPGIRRAPNTVAIGSQFRIYLDSTAPHTFAMVRTGASTHSVNNDNRRIPLKVAKKDGGIFLLNVPNKSSIALPGNYFVFAINSAGVPSIAASISVEIR